MEMNASIEKAAFYIRSTFLCFDVLVLHNNYNNDDNIMKLANTYVTFPLVIFLLLPHTALVICMKVQDSSSP